MSNEVKAGAFLQTGAARVLKVVYVGQVATTVQSVAGQYDAGETYRYLNTEVARLMERRYWIEVQPVAMFPTAVPGLAIRVRGLGDSSESPV